MQSKDSAMPHKDPTSYPIITYVWVLALSVWGGVTHNIRKIKTGQIQRFSISEMVGDIAISGFLGVMTFYLCEYAKFDTLLTAFMVGTTAHMGTRGMMMLEEVVAKRLGTKVPPRPSPGDNSEEHD